MLRASFPWDSSLACQTGYFDERSEECNDSPFFKAYRIINLILWPVFSAVVLGVLIRFYRRRAAGVPTSVLGSETLWILLVAVLRITCYALTASSTVAWREAVAIFDAGSLILAITACRTAFRWLKLGLQIKLQTLAHPKITRVRVAWGVGTGFVSLVFAICAMVGVIGKGNGAMSAAFVAQIMLTLLLCGASAVLALQFHRLHTLLRVLLDASAAVSQSYSYGLGQAQHRSGGGHSANASPSLARGSAGASNAAARSGASGAAAAAMRSPLLSDSDAEYAASGEADLENGRRARTMRLFRALALFCAAIFAVSMSLLLSPPFDKSGSTPNSGASWSPAAFLALRTAELLLSALVIAGVRPEESLLTDAAEPSAAARVPASDAHGHATGRDASYAYNYSYGAGLAMDDDRYAGISAPFGGYDARAGVSVVGSPLNPSSGRPALAGTPLAVSARLHAGSLGAAAAGLGYSAALYTPGSHTGQPASGDGFSRFGGPSASAASGSGTQAVAVGQPAALLGAPAAAAAATAAAGQQSAAAGSAVEAGSVDISGSGTGHTVGSRYSFASSPISYASYGQFSPYAPQGHQSRFVLNAENKNAAVGSPEDR